MVYSSTYKDVFYNAAKESMVYIIRLGSTQVPVFYGRAFRSPQSDILSIDIGKVASQYLTCEMPDFRDYGNNVIRHSDAVMDFNLYEVQERSVGEGATAYTEMYETLLETYRFLYAWDYDDVWGGEDRVLSNPVNGHMDPRMKLFFSTYLGSGATMEITSQCPVAGSTPSTGSTPSVDTGDTPFFLVTYGDRAVFTSTADTWRVEFTTNVPLKWAKRIKNGVVVGTRYLGESLYINTYFSGADYGFGDYAIEFYSGGNADMQADRGTYLGRATCTVKDASGTGTTGDYASQYLTFEIVTDGKVWYTSSDRINTYSPVHISQSPIVNYGQPITPNTIEYSLDSGQTWSVMHTNEYIDVVSGDTILWKGIAATRGNDNFYARAGGNAKFNVYGNIMSILYGDDFRDKTEIPDYAFQWLFQYSNVVNAENLVLPTEYLTIRCYGYMFKGCDYLETAPQLPSMHLADLCYIEMFDGCKNLTSCPDLPALVLKPNCYDSMFAYCPQITETPVLPAPDINVWGCYAAMFLGSYRDTDPSSPGYNPDSRLSHLTKVTCLAEEPPRNIYNPVLGYSMVPTSAWLEQVPESGTFIRKAGVDWHYGSIDSSDAACNGVPVGWTLVDYVEE